MANNKKFVFSLWGPVIVWAAIIFYMSSIPGLKTNLGVWDFVLRKFAHIVEFAILTLLLFRAISQTWMEWTYYNQLFVSGISALVYAVSDEIHQFFVPLRGPSVRDVIIDSIGIVLVIYSLKKKSNGSQNESSN